MLDIRLLQAMRNAHQYKKLAGFVPAQALDPATRVLMDDFGAYYEKFPDHAEIDYESFMSWFETFQHPDHNADTKAVMRNMMRRALVEEPPEGTVAALLSELHELKLVHSAQAIVQKWSDGELKVPVGDIMKAALERYKLDCGVSMDAWVRPNIDELLAEEINDTGLIWPLPVLNLCCRPARPGDFGIIAARPDRGKTYWVGKLCTFWANQLPQNRPIIWLNNEGPGKRIYLKLMRTALSTNLAGMQALHTKGELHNAYNAALGGPDRIRVLDIHGLSTAQVDALLEMHQPSVIVYDMLDNITMAGTQAPRQDLVAEQKYQWARERSVKYDAIGLATSQINGEGDGLLYPTMKMLKDSATTKQGACDFIMMLGSSNDSNLANVRGLSMPKNKLRRDGAPLMKAELIVNYNTSSYEEMGADSGLQMPQEQPAPNADVSALANL